MPELSYTLTNKGNILPLHPEEVSGAGDESADDPNQRYAERIGRSSIVAVPRDCDYRVTWTAESSGMVDCLWLECSGKLLMTGRRFGAAGSVSPQAACPSEDTPGTSAPIV